MGEIAHPTIFVGQPTPRTSQVRKSTIRSRTSRASYAGARIPSRIDPRRNPFLRIMRHEIEFDENEVFR